MEQRALASDTRRSPIGDLQMSLSRGPPGQALQRNSLSIFAIEATPRHRYVAPLTGAGTPDHHRVISHPARGGESAQTHVHLKGRRPLFGQATVRLVTVEADHGEEQLSETFTFIQKPRIPEGVGTIVTLGAIVALWALVFTWAIANVLARTRQPRPFEPTSSPEHHPN